MLPSSSITIVTGMDAFRGLHTIGYGGRSGGRSLNTNAFYTLRRLARSISNGINHRVSKVAGGSGNLIASIPGQTTTCSGNYPVIVIGIAAWVWRRRSNRQGGTAGNG